MADVFVFIGGILWLFSLLFLVFSAGVALLSFSFTLLLFAVILFASVSGVMVVAGALK